MHVPLSKSSPEVEGSVEFEVRKRRVSMPRLNADADPIFESPRSTSLNLGEYSDYAFWKENVARGSTGWQLDSRVLPARFFISDRHHALAMPQKKAFDGRVSRKPSCCVVAESLQVRRDTRYNNMAYLGLLTHGHGLLSVADSACTLSSLARIHRLQLQSSS